MKTHLVSALFFILISSASATEINSLSPRNQDPEVFIDQSPCVFVLTSRGSKNQCNTPSLSNFSQFKQETTKALTSDKTLNHSGTRSKSMDNPDRNNTLLVTHGKLHRRGSR